MNSNPIAPGVANLYREPFPSNRTGDLYNAFSYPTKIDPEAVAVFLAVHTQPGGTVLDPFGGSGSTAIAASLCDRPTERMRVLAERAGVIPEWGPRTAVVYELSPLGALLGRVMSTPPDPDDFIAAATRLLDTVQQRFGWMYDATSPDGDAGQVRYVIWSEVLQTPCCGEAVSLWDATVTLDPAAMAKSFPCPRCCRVVDTDACVRAVEERTDALAGELNTQRVQVPVQVYGQSKGLTWSRPPTAEDVALIDRIDGLPVPIGIPTERIAWGDLHRAGYHTGISRFHHLYTSRNLRAMAALWEQIGGEDVAVADALRLLVLSYNASHATRMTRVVAKKHQRDLVVTGAQSGVLYVSGLPVEKNIFAGLRRKIRTFSSAFSQTRGSQSKVTVVCGSSTHLDLENGSVDYMFTDPPFGDFIPYAEINQVNEVWLGRLTDRTEEVIISPSQKKGVADYSVLMARVFAEVARVLRPEGTATVVFHASKPAVWHAVADAFSTNGFGVLRTSVLDKAQVSFKQAVHAGGTRGDALFLLCREHSKEPVASDTSEPFEVAIAALLAAAAGDPAELEPRRLYSRYVARCLARRSPVGINAPDFYARVRGDAAENA